jgi:hypothetical protein
VSSLSGLLKELIFGRKGLKTESDVDLGLTRGFSWGLGILVKGVELRIRS